MMPVLILIFILVIGLFFALLQSLGYIPGLGLTKINFKYYREIFMNKDFLESLSLSLYIALVSSIISVLVGVLISLALVKVRNKKTFISIVRLPILVPHAIVAIFILAIFSQSGILSRIFYQLGWVKSIKDFPNLIYNKTNMGVIVGYIWKQAPFVAYFTLSLLESISHTYEEAAINLGASPFQAFSKVTLPLIIPNIFSSFIIILAFSFASYELPFLLGTTKPKALPILAYLEYIHPDLHNRPYAMAQNGIIVIISSLLAILFYLLVKNKWKELNIDEKK